MTVPIHTTKTLPFETQQSHDLNKYKYLIFFSMLFISIMICNVILTNRYINLSTNIFVLGGTFTSPLIFILGDIVAEIFGYRVAKHMIWSGFACQAIFAIICKLVAHAPFPIFFKDYYSYSLIFSQLPYMVISSFVAYLASSLINIRIITKWKVLLHGRYFWLRSLGSSTIAEALYSAIAIIMMEMGTLSVKVIWQLIFASYLIKVTYSLIFAGPSNVLVNFIKYKVKIDVYDYPMPHTQFRKRNSSQAQKQCI